MPYFNISIGISNRCYIKGKAYLSGPSMALNKPLRNFHCPWHRKHTSVYQNWHRTVRDMRCGGKSILLRLRDIEGHD